MVRPPNWGETVTNRTDQGHARVRSLSCLHAWSVVLCTRGPQCSHKTPEGDTPEGDESAAGSAARSSVRGEAHLSASAFSSAVAFATLPVALRSCRASRMASTHRAAVVIGVVD